MELLLYPDHRLLRASTPVVDFASLTDTITEMMVKCAQWKGHALAAPQVGIQQRFFVIHKSDLLISHLAKTDGVETPFPTFIANPQVVEESGTFQFKESCLSMPGVAVSLTRPAFIRVRYQDPAGDVQLISCGGLLARVIQHEIDHLDGKVFVERLDLFTKSKVIGAINKLRRKATNRKDTISLK